VQHASRAREHQHVEWKESWRDEYQKWICGFANADGDILGIMVDVNLFEENGKEFVRIGVEAYPNPISYKGEYYYRSGRCRGQRSLIWTPALSKDFAVCRSVSTPTSY
jgi:predicted HTH transcriptional regulator